MNLTNQYINMVFQPWFLLPNTFVPFGNILILFITKYIKIYNALNIDK